MDGDRPISADDLVEEAKGADPAIRARLEELLRAQGFAPQADSLKQTGRPFTLAPDLQAASDVIESRMASRAGPGRSFLGLEIGHDYRQRQDELEKLSLAKASLFGEQYKRNEVDKATETIRFEDAAKAQKEIHATAKELAEQARKSGQPIDYMQAFQTASSMHPVNVQRIKAIMGKDTGTLNEKQLAQLQGLMMGPTYQEQTSRIGTEAQAGVAGAAVGEQAREHQKYLGGVAGGVETAMEGVDVNDPKSLNKAVDTLLAQFTTSATSGLPGEADVVKGTARKHPQVYALFAAKALPADELAQELGGMTYDEIFGNFNPEKAVKGSVPWYQDEALGTLKRGTTHPILQTLNDRLATTKPGSPEFGRLAEILAILTQKAIAEGGGSETPLPRRPMGAGRENPIDALMRTFAQPGNAVFPSRR